MSKREDLIPRPKSRFVKVKCPDCGNEQEIFGNASMRTQCNVCGAALSEPSGGKAKIVGEIIDILE